MTRNFITRWSCFSFFLFTDKAGSYVFNLIERYFRLRDANGGGVRFCLAVTNVSSFAAKAYHALRVITNLRTSKITARNKRSSTLVGR